MMCKQAPNKYEARWVSNTAHTSFHQGIFLAFTTRISQTLHVGLRIRTKDKDILEKYISDLAVLRPSHTGFKGKKTATIYVKPK